jgi:hypothetical protein
MVHMTKFHDDPALDELLGDPMTRAIMRADRVDPLKLEAMLRSLAREIAGRSGASPTALVEAEGVRFDRNAVGPLSQPVGVFQDTASSCVSGPGMRSRHCGAP